MKLRKVAIFFMIMTAVGWLVIGNSSAAEWPINGTVISAGMQNDVVTITIKDVNDNYWYATATASLANEILATALTAIAGQFNVMGMYDTDTAQWLDLMISTE